MRAKRPRLKPFKAGIFFASKGSIKKSVLKKCEKWEVMRMKKTFYLFLIAVLLFSAGAAYAAQWANPGLLAAPDTIKANASKPDWVVLDCRSDKAYANGHIPGAISLGKECKKALRDGTARVFSDVGKYEGILGNAGIGNDTNVIVYGEKKSHSMEDATVAFWVLEYLGQAGKVYVLNGGLDSWLRAGGKLDQAPASRPAAVFKPRVDSKRIAPTDEVLRVAKGEETGVTLIDARSKKEYTGEDIRALRGGHVPRTTANIPHSDLTDEKGMLTPDAAEEAFGAFDKNRRTIAYCQTGTRSTTSYLVLRLMGFKDPANWDDSWVVWADGASKGYPVESEQWIDLSRIKKLEDELKALQERVEAERK
jgi:thiosulfate/3-mercaptopyruvate sulfurtransferase